MSEIELKDKEIERLKEELQIEKATNKELESIGTELENKLYEEQDKNKKLNNRIDKAIESVQKHYDNSYSTDDVNDIGSGTYDNLMEILKGSNGVIPPEVIGTNGEDGGMFDCEDR